MVVKENLELAPGGLGDRETGRLLDYRESGGGEDHVRDGAGNIEIPLGDCQEPVASHASPPAGGAGHRTSLVLLWCLAITCIMMLAKGHTTNKFWSKHNMVDGPKVMDMVGDSAETNHKILKSDSNITTFRVTLFLPGDHETPQPKLNSDRSKLNNAIMRRGNLLLCKLTQHFLKSTPSFHVKYPVWKHFSDRTLIMIFEGKMLEPAKEKTYEFFMNIALILGVIFLGAFALLILYYLRSWLMRTCWHRVHLGSEHSSDAEVGHMRSMASIPLDQVDQGQERNDDTNDMVIIMKGIQDTDQVSVFIMQGADDDNKISSHVSGGTKCSHQRQPDGSCFMDTADAGIDTVEEVVPADNESKQAEVVTGKSGINDDKAEETEIADGGTEAADDGNGGTEQPAL